MKRNLTGPPIMEGGIQAAIINMKLGKATGLGSISVDFLEALEDYGTDKMARLLNEICGPGQIPSDISTSIFIALPKKPGAT